MVCVGVIDQDKSKIYVYDLKKECDKIQAQPEYVQKLDFSFQDEFDCMRTSHNLSRVVMALFVT